MRLGEGCLTESSKFAQISMAAFAKPLLCAGRFISTKFNLKTMSNSETCERCKGKGYYEALVSQHDDKKETIKCEKCNGEGTVYQMTEKEENDYWEDYW